MSEQMVEESLAIKAVEAVLRDAGARYVLSCPSPESGFDVEVKFEAGGPRLYVEYCPAVSPVQFGVVARRLLAALPPGAVGGFVVRRLSVTLLDACKAQGLCVFDLDRNAYVNMPGVYVERYRPGAREQRLPSAGTCFTAKASRLVRALFDRYPHDSTQAELARQTGLSRGYVSILTARLVKDGYVSNNMDLLYLEEPDRLLDAWATHYRFDRHARSHWALAMNTYEQGLEKLAKVLQEQGVGYAYTGWSASHLRAPYASPDTLMAYVDKAPVAQTGLHPVERQGNVVLLVPQDAGVFQFTTGSDYGPVVCSAQAYVDLCCMPGRAREQADALRHDRLSFGGKHKGV